MQLYDPKKVEPERCYLSDGTVLLVLCQPELPWYLHKRLHELRPSMDFEWDSWLKRWTIWDKPIMKEPYRYTVIKNEDGSFRPIDERVFRQLRFDMWYSTHILRRLRSDLNETSYKKERREKQYYNEYLDRGKDLAPLGVSLLDAQSTGASHTVKTFKYYKSEGIPE